MKFENLREILAKGIRREYNFFLTLLSGICSELRTKKGKP